MVRRVAKTKWLERRLILGPCLALCGSEKEYHAALKDLNLTDREGGKWVASGATTHTFDNKCEVVCIVCIDFTKTGERTLDSIVGILAHEATHVWQALMEEIGETRPSSEFQAYGIQAITQRLFKEFLRRKAPYKEQQDGSPSTSVHDGSGCDTK